MATIFLLESNTEFLVLLLVTLLFLLPSVKCQHCDSENYALKVKIFSAGSSSTSPTGTSVNLTCQASQAGKRAKPRRIEWFLHNEPRGAQCEATSQGAKVMSCSLIVTKENAGNYTCKASDSKNQCTTITFKVDFQGIETLQATTESARQNQEPKQENGISDTRKTETYMLYVIAIILVLVCCFLLGFWLRRRAHRTRAKRKSPRFLREIIPLDKWEILPEQISYEEKLGQGAFGVVYKGTLKKREGIEVFYNRKNLKPEKEYQIVAVKLLQGDPSDEPKEMFLHEIEQMKLLGVHQNIVSFVGCCTLQEQKFLVIEYVPFGDLLQWLRHRRQSLNGQVTTDETDEEEEERCYDDKQTFNEQRGVVKPVEIEIMEDLSPSKDKRDVIIDMSLSSEDNIQNPMSQGNIPLVSRSSTPQQNSFTADVLDHDKNEVEDNSFTTQQLFSFAWQIARGMNHLAEKNFVHRDLAARNILVGGDNRVKVSDFGLMRQIYEDVRGKEKCTKLPVKWMAPESLFRHEFTIKSDTWSYGILLWEMATMGGVPYPTLSSSELCRLLKTGYRMERPEMCCDEIYELMSDCWREKPSRRPSFSELIDRLEVIMTRDVLYCDLSKHDESRPYYNVPAKFVENSEKESDTE